MLSRILCLIVLFGAVPAPAAVAQIQLAQHAQLRAALDRHDLPATEAWLREAQRRSPEAFARNNYDYLLARVLEWRGAQAEAAATYRQVAARLSPLAGYALWHQAEIERAAVRPAAEQALLRKLIEQFPNHLLRERAAERLSESYSKAGQHQEAIAALRALGGPRRDLLARIGEEQLSLKQTAAARASFESVLAGGALDDSSLRAALGLDRADAPAPAPLPEAERLRRARIYQFNRYFAEARRHWLALVRDFPQSPGRAEALFQLGRGHFLQNNFAEARKWYDQVHAEFPDSDEGELGFYHVGHCHQYLDETDPAVARYETFLREYPESDYVGYAYLNAIDTLRSAGRLKDALAWAGRAQTNVKDPFIVVTALFQQAKIRLTEENFAAALADLTALRAKGLGVRGQVATTSVAEVAFMRAYCLEKLGRYDEAIAEYLAQREGRGGAAGYYGRRGTERLRALGANLRARSLIAARRDGFLAQAREADAQGNAAAAKAAAGQALRLAEDEAARGEMRTVLRAAYERLPGYRLPSLAPLTAGRTAPLGEGAAPAAGASHETVASELLFLGLYDEGARELAETGLGATRDGAYTVAANCARGQCAHRTIKLSEPILNGLPDDYRPELLPRPWAEMFYPLPYRDALARQAAPRGVDPRFVLSIARQESRYDPRVKSSAAARGMLQFIPSTADQIAAQAGLADFEQSDLYNPDVAILLGAQYMKNLFDEFGHPQAVAAAYNGSEESVRRWVARARSRDVDRFVIEVAKRETKEYVFKVMSNLWAYQALYQEKWMK